MIKSTKFDRVQHRLDDARTSGSVSESLQRRVGLKQAKQFNVIRFDGAAKKASRLDRIQKAHSTSLRRQEREAMRQLLLEMTRD